MASPDALTNVTLAPPTNKTTVDVRELVALRRELDLSPEDFFDITGVNPHRLRRGRIHGPVTLSASAAAEMVRCRKLYKLALELCGDRDSALDWLYSPSAALEKNAPIDLTSSDAGLGKIEALLHKLRAAAAQSAPVTPVPVPVSVPVQPVARPIPQPASTDRFRIAEGLRKARTAIPELTKAELARRMQQAGFAKFQTSTASRYEYGYADATWNEVQALAQILGVTTEVLRAGK